MYLGIMRKKSRHIKSLKQLTHKKSNSYWGSYQYCQTISKMNATQYTFQQDRSHFIHSKKSKVLNLQISSLSTSSHDYSSLYSFSVSRNTVTHIFNQKMSHLCKCKVIIDIWLKSSTLVNFQEMNLFRIHSRPTIFSILWENIIRETVWSSTIYKTDSKMSFSWLWEPCKGLWLERVMFLKT